MDTGVRLLSDDDLLAQLSTLVQRDRRLTAAMLAHLAEVDERRLYLREACSSMFTYCRDVLRFAEGVAYDRIHAARAARTYPALFGLVESGALHLTAIRLLAPHLTDDNQFRRPGAARQAARGAGAAALRGAQSVRGRPLPGVPNVISLDPRLAAFLAALRAECARQGTDEVVLISEWLGYLPFGQYCWIEIGAARDAAERLPRWSPEDLDALVAAGRAELVRREVTGEDGTDSRTVYRLVP